MSNAKRPALSAVGFILKRYPRLSETFILNEIRALERLGVPLHIFSLLPPEPGLVHPAVSEVQAPVVYLPRSWLLKIWTVLVAHFHLIGRRPQNYMKAIVQTGVWSVRIRRPFETWKQFMRAGAIANECHRLGIRHLHAHFVNTPSVVAQLVSTMSDISFSFTAHAKDLYLTPARVVNKQLAQAAFAVTCTGYNREYMCGLIGQEAHPRIHLIYHGIDPSEFSSSDKNITNNNTAAEPLILSVGRLVPKKGFSDIILACASLRARGIAFRCLIVGAGPLRGTLEALVSQHNLEGQIIFTGAMAHDRLITLFQEANVFALASRITEDGDRDGIPNVLTEAMASSVPVVTTAVSGIPELVEHERTGLLVAPEDPEALADAIGRVLQEPLFAKQLAHAASHRLHTEFDCWQTAQTLAHLFAETTNQVFPYQRLAETQAIPGQRYA